MREIRIFLAGYGNTGKLIARYAEKHGGIICGVTDKEHSIQNACSYKFFPDIKMIPESLKPDIAVISVESSLEGIAPLVRFFLNRGINVITTSEEAIFPKITSPDLLLSLDMLAKENGCTFSASGFQDCFWIYSVTAFASSCSTINRIHGNLKYNIDDYGASLASDHGVGMSIKEFKENFRGNNIPSYIWNSNTLLAEKLGWIVTNQKQECVPYVCPEDVYCCATGKIIPKGFCTGMHITVTTETCFGGVIETECTGKIYTTEDSDLCRWHFSGEPPLTFEIKSPRTLEHTAASIVNRIPQIINAQPGYITIDRLGNAEYLTYPLFLYTL